MKNKFLFFWNSIKQSIVNKPFVFILMFLVIITTTICTSIPIRLEVRGIREDYESGYRISGRIVPNDFLDNRMLIGDYVFNNRSKLKHKNFGVQGYFTAYNYDCDIKINGKEIILDKIVVDFMFTAGYGITEENILNNQAVVVVGENLAKENNVKVGDIVNLYGNDLKVQKIGGSKIFIVPYNLPINKWYKTSYIQEYETKPVESECGFSIRGLKHFNLGGLKSIIRQSKVKIEPNFTGAHSAILLLIGLLFMCAISTMSIMNYWLKCNSQKYSTFKTLGCSPLLLAVAMIIETFIIAIISIGIGVLIDYIISLIMQTKIVFPGYEWLYYLILIGGQIVSIAIVSLIAIIKRAKALPADSKFNR